MAAMRGCLPRRRSEERAGLALEPRLQFARSFCAENETFLMPKSKKLRSYREGGNPDPHDASRTASGDPQRKEQRNWSPGDKGQGREGLSKGLGGSGGDGTNVSGPESDEDAQRKQSRRREDQ